MGSKSPTKEKAFYAAVLGWEAQDLPLPQGGDYSVLKVRGREAAGLYELSDDQKAQKVPPHWLVYVAVEDAEQSAKIAKTLGGKIVVDAYDVSDLGRMAILLDPTGAMFALWEENARPGMRVMAGEPGSLCWCELMTTDLDKAASFYAGLFGWRVEMRTGDGHRHAHCLSDDEPVADLMAAGNVGGIPPHWLAYFAVRDCTAATVAVGRAGGRTLVGASPLADGTSFAIARDPEGAVFGLMDLGDGLTLRT